MASVFRCRRLVHAWLLFSLLTLPLAAVSAPPPPRIALLTAPSGHRDRGWESVVEIDFVARINHDRGERGLPLLRLDPLLMRIARAHSLDMSATGAFSHVATMVGPRTPDERYVQGLRRSGRPQPLSFRIGENLYSCFGTDADDLVDLAHQALMNSPQHRANILDAGFTKAGVGVFRDGAGRFWVTQMFIGDR